MHLGSHSRLEVEDAAIKIAVPPTEIRVLPNRCRTAKLRLFFLSGTTKRGASITGALHRPVLEAVGPGGNETDGNLSLDVGNGVVHQLLQHASRRVLDHVVVDERRHHRDRDDVARTVDDLGDVGVLHAHHVLAVHLEQLVVD